MKGQSSKVKGQRKITHVFPFTFDLSPLSSFLSVLLFVLTFLIHAAAYTPASAQGVSSTQTATPAGALPFTLIIVGTRHLPDVDVIKRNVQRIAGVGRLVPAVSNQNHLQFKGTFSGTREALVADIEGLAAERFDLKANDDPSGSLIITLRKMAAAP